MPTAADIANALDAVPAWTKLALCAPKEALRIDATDEIARLVHIALYGANIEDERQLALPLA